MNTDTPVFDAEPVGFLTEHDHEIMMGSIYRSNDPRDGMRPPYEVVGFNYDSGKVLLEARPALANWPLRPYSDKTSVIARRFGRNTTKGWMPA